MRQWYKAEIWGVGSISQGGGYFSNWNVTFQADTDGAAIAEAEKLSTVISVSHTLCVTRCVGTTPVREIYKGEKYPQ